MELYLNFFSDDSHGWLEVPTMHLRALGIANDISQYSYRKGDNSYLEEDCDASIFLRKAEAEGIKVRILNHPQIGRSRIRNYVPYKLLAPQFA